MLKEKYSLFIREHSPPTGIYGQFQLFRRLSARFNNEGNVTSIHRFCGGVSYALTIEPTLGVLQFGNLDQNGHFTGDEIYIMLLHPKSVFALRGQFDKGIMTKVSKYEDFKVSFEDKWPFPILTFAEVSCFILF